ncbi:MAG: DUF1028 domain-containing protein [Hyphomicrobiaceae bacterium]
MTFSLVARCARTGMFGVAIATSSICVGARCSHARAGVGAVATQNVTDPLLGTLVLDELEAGSSAVEAVEAVVRVRPHIAYRQLIAVDDHGHTAQFTGSNTLGEHAVHQSGDCVAAGNLLATHDVPFAMTESFTSSCNQHLGERLLVGLEAGRVAGGEAGQIHSAALLVVSEHPFPLVDLRVDWDGENPIGELRELWTAYEPQMIDYLMRATDPTSAPSYGVDGDP